MSLKDQVAIIGVGYTKFGELYDKSYEDLAVEAVNEALADAKLEPAAIEAAWVGTYNPGAHGGKAGTSLADPLKLFGKPMTRVENYCCSGTDAFRNACMAVAAGVYDRVLVAGVEKMKDRSERGLALGGRHPLIGHGQTAPGTFALSATRYMHETGMARSTMAKVAVKNHYNGSFNKKAHMQTEVSLDKVLGAPMIAWPFGLFDCCPTTDGAAAAVICRASLARAHRPDYVLVKGAGLCVMSARPYHDPNYRYDGFDSTKGAAKQAYEMAGIKDPVKEIGAAEVHDCFTMTEILNYEDLGFAPKGRGWTLIEEGRTALTGDIPVNPSGGLKSFGHPVGASGVRMIAEITHQIRGEAGARQIKNVRQGLAHNVGGPGAVSCVIVLGAP